MFLDIGPNGKTRSPECDGKRGISRASPPTVDRWRCGHSTSHGKGDYGFRITLPSNRMKWAMGAESDYYVETMDILSIAIPPCLRRRQAAAIRISSPDKCPAWPCRVDNYARP